MFKVSKISNDQCTTLLYNTDGGKDGKGFLEEKLDRG